MPIKKEKYYKVTDEKSLLSDKERVEFNETLEKLNKDLASKVKYDPAYVAVVAKLSAAGFNQYDIAWILGISARTLRYWKKHYPLFKKAIDDGKHFVKKKLIASAIRAAMGYDYEEIETLTEWKKTDNPDKELEFVRKKEIRKKKHHPINASLLTFLLVNLDRQLDDNEWYHPWASAYKDLRGQVNINIDGKLESERIERLCGKLLESEDKAKKVESKIINNKDINENR